MNKTTLSAALLLAGFTSMPATAHVFYAGWGLGIYTGLEAASGSKTGVFDTPNDNGWADAADADWGDSYRGRFLKFTLENPANVSISVSVPNAGFLPGYSLYQGLVPNAAHDSSAAAMDWRNLQPTPENPLAASEGFWNAMGDFCGFNDSGTGACLTFVGYGVDGTAANFGSNDPNVPSAPGIIGDGTADGFVINNFFNLPAGDYSIIVGGATYADLTTSVNRPFTTTLKVAPVPLPAAFPFMLSGLGLLGSMIWRKSAGISTTSKS